MKTNLLARFTVSVVIGPIFSWALLFVTLPVAAATIAGQRFEDSIHLADVELQLNGVGLRAVAWFNGYAAGLYLKEKAATLPQVLSVNGPKRLEMKMMYGVDTKEFTKAIDVGIRRNSTPDELAALLERMEQFGRTVDRIGSVKKGDVIDLDFIPDRGLIISVNGVAHGAPIPGSDLYDGLLKIFVGTRPVDQRLKAGLLGGAPS